MSGQLKPVINAAPVLSSGFTASTATAATSFRYMDNVDYQILADTSNATGTFAFQVSLVDPSSDLYRTMVAASIDPWVTNPDVAIPALAGADAVTLIEINQTGAFWGRISYTTTFIETADITTVADVAGSLNSKYWLLNGADGTNWYIWYNINSAGVDPAVAGRTGISVAGATGASANTLASATKTALSACTSITTIGGATNHVTFAQSIAGHGSIADGTAPTGFTFSGYTTANGTLTILVSGKSI